MISAGLSLAMFADTWSVLGLALLNLALCSHLENSVLKHETKGEVSYDPQGTTSTQTLATMISWQ